MIIDNTGQRWDEGLGLYDYNARYYDPVLGRFISADTIVPGLKHTAFIVDFHAFLPGASGSGSMTLQALNRYTYSLNNPERYVDPTGHDPELEGEVSLEQAQEMLMGLEEVMDYLENVLSDLTKGISDWFEGFLEGLGVNLSAGAMTVGLVQLTASLIASGAILELIAGGALGLAGIATGSATAGIVAGILAPFLIILALVIITAGAAVLTLLTSSISQAINQFEEIRDDLKAVVDAEGVETIRITGEALSWGRHEFTFTGLDKSGNVITARAAKLGVTSFQLLGMGDFTPSKAIMYSWESVMNSRSTTP